MDERNHKSEIRHLKGIERATKSWLVVLLALLVGCLLAWLILAHPAAVRVQKDMQKNETTQSTGSLTSPRGDPLSHGVHFFLLSCLIPCLNFMNQNQPLFVTIMLHAMTMIRTADQSAKA